MTTTRRLDVQVVIVLLVVAVVDYGGCGKAAGGVAKKEMRRMSAGLKKIGVTEDQVEGVEAVAREGGKMYLSFLTGSKERRKAMELLKEGIPQLKISKKTIEGSKCLKLKLRAGSAPASGGSGAEDGPSKEAHEPQEDAADPAPERRVSGTGEVPEGGMSEKEVKHVKYLRSLAKKLRKTLDTDKKMADGRPLQPEQKEILARRGELIKEIAAARRSAEDMKCPVPEQMNQEFEELLLTNLASSTKPQIASRNVLEAAHVQYEAEMKAALAGKRPRREPEPIGQLGVPIDWGLGDTKKLIKRGDGASGFERQEPKPNPNDFLVKRA